MQFTGTDMIHGYRAIFAAEEIFDFMRVATYTRNKLKVREKR